MLLTGTFTRSVDEKLRVAIPKPIREALVVSIVYIAPGTDGSLSIYTAESLARLAEQLSKASPAGQDVRAFNRMFYSQAQRVELDQQGRLRVPSDLAELIGLGREGVLLGVHDHLELWDAARWTKYLAEKQGRFDEIAEAAFGSVQDGT